MITFRILEPNNEEIIFGLNNENNLASIEKLNNGTRNLRPYKYLVPFYKNAKFSFNSFNCLKFFLFNVCNLNQQDLEELDKLGFKVVKLDLCVYSKGLSKLFCTYFDDEVVESFNPMLFTELFANADSMKYNYVNLTPASSEDSRQCKDHYYKTIKFKN